MWPPEPESPVPDPPDSPNPKFGEVGDIVFVSMAFDDGNTPGVNACRAEAWDPVTRTWTLSLLKSTWRRKLLSPASKAALTGKYTPDLSAKSSFQVSEWAVIIAFPKLVDKQIPKSILNSIQDNETVRSLIR